MKRQLSMVKGVEVRVLPHPQKEFDFSDFVFIFV